MNQENLDQVKSYSTLIVSELHKIVFDDVIFDRIKVVLALAEEMEHAMMNIERKQKENRNNVIPLRRIA